MSEPYHGAYKTQVRAVLPGRKELLDQLTKDATLMQNNYMHMCLSSNAQVKRPQALTKY